MNILDELRRRKVLTSALFYVPFAWIATEVLTFLFARFSVPSSAVDLVAAAFVAGFPAFMVLAWTFDIGPQGLTRTSASRAQGCVVILLSALIMGLGTTALFFQIASDQPVSATAERTAKVDSPLVNADPLENSIAVYAFENLSSELENAYFSEGMTSELITRLSRIEGMRVAAISQSRQEVIKLGVEPDVSYRLEGSVRKAGNTVRIAARLSNRSDDFVVWSDEFDGDLDNVFTLQEEVALQIILALGVQLSPQESVDLSLRPTDNPQAYNAFLRGWSLIESFHVSLEGAAEKLEKARGHFVQALAIDPEFTRAIAGLSMVESYAVFLGGDPNVHLPLARDLAEEALTMDDSHYESHFAMARVMANADNISGALREYRTVVKLDSQNGYAWCEMSATLMNQDPVGAERAAREAIRFRPAYSLAYFNLGVALQKQDRLDEALDAYQQSLQLDPANQRLRGVIEQLDSGG